MSEPVHNYASSQTGTGTTMLSGEIIQFQPLSEDQLTSVEFSDETVGMNIPKNFIPAIEKV